MKQLTEKYSDSSLADRVFDLAWTHGHILCSNSASEADAQVYGRLPVPSFMPRRLRRAKANILSRNRRGQSGLWGYGISGDLPIVLVRIRDHERIALVRQAVQAHAYWRLKGLAVDLIWNEDDSVYRQTLQEPSSISSPPVPKPRSSTGPAGFLSAAASRCRTTIAICCRPWRTSS